jgi:chemotaxis response regulator CheB
VSVTAVVDDYALAAVPGLDADLARAGALVMRSFRGTPSPHLLRNGGVAVVGGPDRAGLVARLERATATVAAPVIGILPPGVAAEPALRGPGVVDLIPASASGIAARVLLMARVPVVSPGRRLAAPVAPPRPPAPPASAPPADGTARAGLGAASEVIAFASSTGGVWVLADALRALPRGGRAVLVAQHLEAEFVPFFAEWLGSATGWRVAVVDAPAALEPGVVYVPTGGRDLVLVGRAAVEAPPASSRFVPSGDRLLASLAAAGIDATGVVLSGMGADGAEGLATLARRGGIALCQAPVSAAVPSMPEAALARSRAVIPVPPDALAAAIGARQGDARASPSARR